MFNSRKKAWTFLNFLLLMIKGLSDVLNDENSQRNFVCQKKGKMFEIQLK